MDGLSSAASVITVAAIALQLANSINDLVVFWKSVKDAPADIQRIADHLDLDAKILAGIARESQHDEPDEILIAALQLEQLEVTSLRSIVNRLRDGFASDNLKIRKWTALKARFKSEELKKYQDVLASLKSTILMVQQLQLKRSTRHSFHVLMTSPVPGLAIQRPFELRPAIVAEPTDFQGSTSDEVQTRSRGSSNVSSRPVWTKKRLYYDNIFVNCGFGTIDGGWTQLVLKHKNESDQVPDQKETHYSYRFVPAEWLQSLGFYYRVQAKFSSSSTNGWKNTLQTPRIVPDESLIFTLCKQGDLDGVRSLLTKGDASVRDVDSKGWTPLFYTAKFHKAKLCAYLIDCGADRCASSHGNGGLGWSKRVSRGYTPLHTIPSPNPENTCTAEIIDTLRQFVDLFDLEGNGDKNVGWEILWHLAREYAIDTSRSLPVNQEILLWLLEYLTSDIQRTHFWDWRANLMCIWLHKYQNLNALDYILRAGPANAINLACEPGGFTVIHLAIIEAKYSVAPLLTNDLNLHTSGTQYYCSSKSESPTSLAMYNYWSFKLWFQALLDTGKNFDALVDRETQEGPVLDAGWKASTLRLLFKTDILEEFFELGCFERISDTDFCSDCSVYRFSWDIRVQPYWLMMLEAVKTGNPPLQWLEQERSKSEVATTQGLELGQGGDERCDSEDLGCQETCPLSSTEPTTGFDEGQRPYGVNDIVCYRCWDHFEKYGKRYKEPESEDSSDEEDYSPFHVHS